MATKQTAVNVKEARLIDQWLHSNIASTTWGDLINFLGKDLKNVTKVVEELEKSELYFSVGKDIEKRANEIVAEKCEPEWNRISEEMRPLGEERNVLAKEKAANEEGVWGAEKEERLTQIDVELSRLSNDYQKVTDDANAELNEYKEKRINEEQGACFFLSEKDYKMIGGYAGF